MTINAQNLFDILDDPNKDDKAFLPIEMKQSEEHKNACNNISIKRWRRETLCEEEREMILTVKNCKDRRRSVHD